VLICQEEGRVNQGISQMLVHVEYSQEMGELECSICLETMEDSRGNFVKTRTCGHVFHQRCLVQWILQNHSCPLCRRQLFEEKVEDRV
jgi:hypothetical protein